MQISAGPAPRFTQNLAAARDELAHVRSAPIDTQQRVDIALGHLHGASSSIHQALAGADDLPAGTPSGATTFPRQAVELLQAASTELGRASSGKSFDVPVVKESVNDAIGRLKLAIGLVIHPPSEHVHDGS